MKDTIAGIVLAVLFLAGLFAAAHYLPHGARNLASVAPAQIPAGFTGNRMVGPWDLLCAANAPAHSTAEPPKTIGAASGRCRLAHGYVDREGRLILVVSFRLLGPQKATAMLVRFPPLAKKGDNVVVKFAQVGLKLPVFGCQADSCVAVGTLTHTAETLVSSAGAAQVVLPPRADGKHVSVGVRLDGLGAGLTGLHRAES